MASSVYGNGLYELTLGNIVWKGDEASPSTIKAMLTKSTYDAAADFSTNANLDDVEATYRVTGTTDATIPTDAGRTSTHDTTNDQIELSDDASVVYSAVAPGDTAGGIIVYKSTGVSSTSTLIAWCKFSSNVSTNGSDITVTIHADGFCKISY